MNTALVTGKDYSITNLPKFWREIAEILDGEKRLAILDFPEGGSLVNPDPVIPFGIYPRTPRPQQHEPAHPAPPGSGQPGGQPGGQIGGHVTVDQFDPIEGTVYHEKRGQPFFPDIVRHMWEGAIPNIGFHPRCIPASERQTRCHGRIRPVNDSEPAYYAERPRRRIRDVWKERLQGR